MIPAHRWWQAAALLVTMPRQLASAQISEFLPEVDVYTGVAHSAQLWFQAKQTREDSGPTQVEIGPSLDF